jgi:hypothetical protein
MEPDRDAAIAATRLRLRLAAVAPEAGEAAAEVDRHARPNALGQAASPRSSEFWLAPDGLADGRPAPRSTTTARARALPV